MRETRLSVDLSQVSNNCRSAVSVWSLDKDAHVNALLWLQSVWSVGWLVGHAARVYGRWPRNVRVAIYSLLHGRRHYYRRHGGGRTECRLSELIRSDLMNRRFHCRYITTTKVKIMVTLHISCRGTLHIVKT